MLLDVGRAERGVQRRRPGDRTRRHDGRGRRRRATRSSSTPSGAEVPDADVPYDPETEELLEGYTYKESTGVMFDAASESLELITQVPEISEDGLAVTATWDSFYVDYQTKPARRRRAGPRRRQARARHRRPDRGQAGAHRRLPEQRRGRAEADRRLLEHRVRRHAACPTTRTSTSAPARTCSPSYDEVSQMTFEANPDYTWGPKPKVADDRLPHHRRPDGRRAGAGERGDRHHPAAVDGRHPAPRSRRSPTAASRSSTGNGGTYEHVDLVFNNGGPFDPATYGGDAEKALRCARRSSRRSPARTSSTG